MIEWKRTLLLIAGSCMLACWPVTARDSPTGTGATPGTTAKLIGMMLDCAIHPPSKSWLSANPALYRDGVLRFSYLRERPRKLRDPNSQDGNPRFGWPDEDLLYVAFWKQSTGTQKTGIVLTIGLSNLAGHTLDPGEYAEIVLRNGKLDYAEPPGGNWTNEAIWYRVEWLEHAPVHTFAVRDIPHTHTVCEAP